MSDPMQEWQRRSEDRHAKEVGQGLHDEQCEFGYRVTKSATGKQGITFMHMCHCKKRRRIHSGFTKPPGPLLVQHPLCPKDLVEVNFEGDSWACPECGVTWATANEQDEGEFRDDYGDDCFGRPLTPEERSQLSN